MPVEGCIGEIRMFAGNFAPRSWALCDGQLLPISGNEALFSILGTTYGGNGFSNFALPDLRGRVAMHPGTGPGLTPRSLGQKGGQETVALTNSNMPSHTHSASTTVTEHTLSGEGDASSPDDAISAKSGAGDPDYGPADDADSTLDARSHTATTNIGNSGNGQPHQNLQPYQCVNYIICLFGVFPSRD